MTSNCLSACNRVISFPSLPARKPATGAGLGLSTRDRIEVVLWEDRARAAGFDRMVPHERDENDAPEVTAFLMVHRTGQAWARWGFTRTAGGVLAWCCLTGADVGYFDTMAAAFNAVLMDVAPAEPRAGTLVPFMRPVRQEGLLF